MASLLLFNREEKPATEGDSHEWREFLKKDRVFKNRLVDYPSDGDIGCLCHRAYHLEVICCKIS
jgi:hypothetical protein